MKIILIKLIHIRHQGYIGIQDTNIHGVRNATKTPILWQQWHESLERAVSIYNNKKNATTGEKPIDAISNFGVTPAEIKTRAVANGIQRNGNQSSYHYICLSGSLSTRIPLISMTKIIGANKFIK